MAARPTGRAGRRTLCAMTRAGGPHEVQAPEGAPLVATALGIVTGTPVLVVAGTTRPIEEPLAMRLLPVLKEIVAFAHEHGITVVTGGTDAGVFHLLSLALTSSAGRPPQVVGVAPDKLVAPAGAVPHGDQAAADWALDVLVRVPGDTWGDEVGPLDLLAAQIAGPLPSALLLAGGGDVSKADLVAHLAAGRAVVALAGSGRLADELGGPGGGAGAAVPDPAVPDLAVLLANGEVASPSLDDPRAVRKALSRALVRKPPRRHLRDRVAVLGVLPRIRPPSTPPPPPLSVADAGRYPLLRSRVAEAERVIYPAFALWDLKASREQNLHRWYSLLAIVGALLTTTAGAAQVWLESVVWPGVAVAGFGAMTSALTTMARRQGTLHNFLDARTRAERLRALYFSHLAQPPGDERTAAADQRDLERKVLQLTSGPVTP
jgi:SLOG in TRPM, prokaryote